MNVKRYGASVRINGTAEPGPLLKEAAETFQAVAEETRDAINKSFLDPGHPEGYFRPEKERAGSAVRCLCDTVEDFLGSLEYHVGELQSALEWVKKEMGDDD
jgi:hypothetical protein